MTRNGTERNGTLGSDSDNMLHDVGPTLLCVCTLFRIRINKYNLKNYKAIVIHMTQHMTQHS